MIPRLPVPIFVELVTQALRAAYNAFLAAEALNASQVHALQLLDGTTGLKMIDLARALPLSPSATTPLVDHLVARGLVARAPVDGDRRTWLVHLTAEGEACLDRFDALRADALRAELRRQPPEVRRAARVALQELLGPDAPTRPRS